MRNNPSIYIVTTSVPGDVGGGEIRNFNLIKQLIRRVTAQVTVFSLALESADRNALQERFESQTKARCQVFPYRVSSPVEGLKTALLKQVPPYMDDFRASEMGEAFRRACEQSLPDVVHIEQVHAYYCIRPHIAWLKSRGVTIVFDCHNIEFQLLKDSLRLHSAPKKLVGHFLVPFLKSLEVEATKQADLVLVCSTSDAEFFTKYNRNVHVIPNGVDCSYFQPAAQDTDSSPALIFVGGVGFPPNGDAMQYYLTEIHPLLKQRIPNLKLLAIGTDAKWLKSMNLSDPSVEALGFVDDIRPYLAKATIGICPIRYGSGTRLKIMTYMAAGLPVVSTRKGAEGVAYTNRRDILMADDAQSFVDSVVALFHDQASSNTIAHNGRAFVLRNYDWNAIGENLREAYEATS